MCCFSPSSIDFSIALGRFAIATAGLIAPQHRTHFDLSAKAETRAAPGPLQRHPVAAPGAVNAFDLNACLTIAAPLDLPERVVEVRT